MAGVMLDTRSLLRALLTGDLATPAGELVVTDSVFQEALAVLVEDTPLRREIKSLAAVPLPEAYSAAAPHLRRAEGADVEIEACSDPGDNQLLAQALAADCDVLVTTVPELLSLEDSPDWQEFKKDNGLHLVIRKGTESDGQDGPEGGG